MTQSEPRARVLEGVTIDPTAQIKRCRSCSAEVWFGRTAAGRACPFNVHRDPQTMRAIYTAETHFSTCPHAREHTRR